MYTLILVIIAVCQLWSVFLPVVNYIFQGTGNYHQCEQLIDNLTTMQHKPPTAGGDYIVSELTIRCCLFVCVLCVCVHVVWVCLCIRVYCTYVSVGR